MRNSITLHTGRHNNSGYIKNKTSGNKDFYLNQVDTSKEFLLKVVEIICGDSIYNENEPSSEEEL